LETDEFEGYLPPEHIVLLEQSYKKKIMTRMADLFKKMLTSEVDQKRPTTGLRKQFQDLADWVKGNLPGIDGAEGDSIADEGAIEGADSETQMQKPKRARRKPRK
jgi:hypothetical protein